MRAHDPLVIERRFRLEHLARALETALRSVRDDAEHVRHFTEHLYRNRAAFGPLPARTYERHPVDGYTWCPRDEGGSTIIVSSRTPFDANARAQAVLTEHLDPLLSDVLKRNPSVVQAYFSTEETICRIAPWFNVEEAIQLKLLAPDFDIREPVHPFNHRANRERNPERNVVWTGLYLDPIGRGWMVSCLAPVYLDTGALRGVVGLDVPVTKLGERLGIEAERDPILLISADGEVLVSSPAARAAKVGTEIAGMIGAGVEGQVEVPGREGQLLAWRRMAETGWTLLHLFPIRESYEELEQRSQVFALAQRLMTRSDAADVAMSVAQATRAALDGDTSALWWSEGSRFRRVAAEGVGVDVLGPPLFAVPAGAMAAAAAAPGRSVGAGSGRMTLALGSPGNTLGFLAIVRRADFSEGDAHLFEILGHTAALGLENVAQFRRLVQAQKMEGLGTIAAAVAHDFNNLLGSILGNASLLRLSVAPVDEQTRRILEIIESSAQRGAALTRQLLQFSRSGTAQRGPVAMATLFTDVLAFLRQSLPKNIRVEVVLPASLPAADVDGVQMQQVLVNLCLNARDAMAQGGTLTLHASTTAPPPSFGGKAGGRWVLIDVRDNGAGMTPEILDRVFDPFYTTKPLGQGTGLGLPIAQRIVRDHGGMIDLVSEVGKGTSARVYLPASARTPVDAPAAVAEVVRTGHGEAILVVDDEPAVLAVVTDALHQAGYAPVAASSGPEALRLLSARGEEIRLIVLDLLMPEMSGVELLRRVRELAPDLRVLVVSGYVQPQLEPALRELGVGSILSKPFTSAQLLERVRRAVADRGTGKRSATPRIRMSPRRKDSGELRAESGE